MRYHLFDPEVAPVIEQLRLAWDRFGSVHALCEHLNERLPNGSQRIHPNRLHAILTGDRKRQTINEATLHRIRKALGMPSIETSDLDLNEWI